MKVTSQRYLVTTNDYFNNVQPLHISPKKPQEFLAKNCEFIKSEDWLPNSHDLNPLYYYLWRMIEMMLKNKKYRTFSGFKKTIKAVWKQLLQGQIANAAVGGFQGLRE